MTRNPYPVDNPAHDVWESGYAAAVDDCHDEPIGRIESWYTVTETKLAHKDGATTGVILVTARATYGVMRDINDRPLVEIECIDVSLAPPLGALVRVSWEPPNPPSFTDRAALKAVPAEKAARYFVVEPGTTSPMPVMANQALADELAVEDGYATPLNHDRPVDKLAMRAPGWSEMHDDEPSYDIEPF